MKYVQNTNTYTKSDDLDIAALSNSLWRGKWFILICIFFCIVLSGFYTKHFAETLYSAKSKIALKERHPRVITDIESVMSGRPLTNLSINTELEILRSYDLVGQLVDRLDLIKHPSFNENLQVPKLSSKFKLQFHALIGKISEEPELLRATNEIRANVIKSALRSITVSNIRKTLVINISVTTNNAALSVLMANTLADLYFENQIKVKLNVLASATNFLSKRTLELKQNFENLKIKMAKFSGQSELVNPDFLAAQETQLRELRTRLADAKKHIIDNTAIWDNLKFLRKSGDMINLINTANDFRLNKVMLKYQNNLITWGALNKEVNNFMAQLDLKAQRNEEQLVALEGSKTILKKQIKRHSQELIVLQQLEREAEAARLLYMSFFKRLQEMNVQLGLETADGRILSRATQNGPSISIDNKTKTLAGIFGLVIATGLIVIKELRFSGYRSINELRENSGKKVLGAVPLIPLQDRKSVISYFKEKPNSVVSEAVRNLRTSILMSNSNRAPQIIMITSSVPQEGKTILTFALAQNMSDLGKRVLLIEADIRKRVLSVHIDRKNTVAFLDLLTGKRKMQDVNPFVDELGFSILTGTKSIINAADIFASERFSQLLTDLREHYDFILIDTPPVLAVPDARVIGANCDANIYIVEWNKTTREQVDQGLEMLSSVGVETNGLVLNQIDKRKMKSYGYVREYGYGLDGSEYYEI